MEKEERESKRKTDALIENVMQGLRGKSERRNATSGIEVKRQIGGRSTTWLKLMVVPAQSL